MKRALTSRETIAINGLKMTVGTLDLNARQAWPESLALARKARQLEQQARCVRRSILLETRKQRQLESV